MLLPKKSKFRKQHRGRLCGKSTANKIVFGDIGLQALEPVWLKSNQIEATRRSITGHVRKTGKLWIRIFPDKPVSARAAETRMGSGKGATAFWVAVVKPGAILFEINGLPREIAYKVLKKASHKLPIRTKVVDRC